MICRSSAGVHYIYPRGPVPVWFELSVRFLGSMSSFPVCSTLLADRGSSDVLQSHEFGVIGTNLFNSNVGCFSVYTDGSLSDLGTVNIKAGAAVFFEDISMGLGVGVSSLMSSTLTELQAIALALECVPSFCSVDLFLDSQAALNACRLQMELVCPDFRNQCWIEHHHIVNVIHHKNLKVNWCKVKRHLGVLGNEQANKLARAAAFSGWHLPHSVDERYLRSGRAAISGNSRHFVRDIFQSVHHAHWEISCGMGVVVNSLCTDIDWFRSSLVWHLDSYMAAGFTSKWTAGFWTYFMKALHYWLLVAILVGRSSSLAHSSSGVSQLMFTCVSDISVSTALCKGFVFKDWFRLSSGVTWLLGVAEAISVGFGFCNNVKHSGDEKDIFLSKAGSSGSVYSDVESLSGEDEDVSMSGTDGGFLLGSAATTSKAK
ncbi:hypothetical protein G9A89_012130 [Geosiphon pyriformis]|nr:hypothetical protein G9A89_012130 [Geosiphon pyriformis]